MKRRRQKEQRTQFLGTYTLLSGDCVTGQLTLKGAKTLLKIYSNEFLPRVESGSDMKGLSHTGEYLTLIDCRSPGTGHTGFKDGPITYHADVFPHYVAIGRRHLDSSQRCISAIHFTTTDLHTLFYDFDAFGHILDAQPIIDVVLQDRRKLRPVEAGQRPQVFYYTGKDCIAEVSTAIGKISVHHRPGFSMGGPTGVFIKNRIVVTVEPSEPTTFRDAIDLMSTVASFLSMAAGRSQGIDNVNVTTTAVVDDVPQSLSVYPSYRWKANDKIDLHKPHPGDVPLDPIGRPEEFAAVLVDWISRNDNWRLARGRYLECMRKANKYSAERLVAAANMFDILPASAVPINSELSDVLAVTRDACAKLFQNHPDGIDRNSALSALGRLGQPSLPKKVAHRVSIVEPHLGDRFEKLDFVAKVAVKCRNFYVHGNSDGVDFSRLEALVPFFTDALEFIFAASDLIEAGWDMRRWKAEMHGWGHNFARFLANYELGLAELQRSTKR